MLAGVRNLNLDETSAVRPDSHCDFGDPGTRRDERPQHGAEVPQVGRVAHRRISGPPSLAYFHTGRIGNGPTEAINLLINKIQRGGHGFRNFHNHFGSGCCCTAEIGWQHHGPHRYGADGTRPTNREPHSGVWFLIMKARSQAMKRNQRRKMLVLGQLS